MSGPSSPTPSSLSDDLTALFDAELQTALDELEDGEEEEEVVDVDVDVDVDDDEGYEATDEAEEGSLNGGKEVLEEEDVGGEDQNREDGETTILTIETIVEKRQDTEWREQFEELDGFRKGKRKREEEDEVTADAKSVKGVCPPHPGFMWDVCIRCGKNRQVSNSEPKPVAVALRYIHEGLELTPVEAARMREDELKQVMLKGKLYLVLDLDHTMLNSARFIEVPREEEAYLVACYFRDSSVEPATVLSHGAIGPAFKGGLHRLDQLQMWTKIRPFAHEFLEAASKLCEMYVYTMGERAYALAMARLLDPTGRFFGDRIISQGDSTCRVTKDLDVVLGAESAVVILDDTEGVWPKHRANLILIERYHFFRSSCRQFGLKNLSMTERKKDESEVEGILATALKALRDVHHTIFSDAALVGNKSLTQIPRQYQDVRNVVQLLKGRILKGCRVVFSRIFPADMPYPEANFFWQLAAELGAHCSTELDPSTTHIVAVDRGTDKARKGYQRGKFVVHPCWLEAARYLWYRPREEDFPVSKKGPEPPLTTFAKTVDVIPPLASFSETIDVAQESRQGQAMNGLLQGSHTAVLKENQSSTKDVTNEIKESQPKEVLDPGLQVNN